MKNLFLSLVLALSTVSAVSAQSLQPLDLPGSVLVPVSAANVDAVVAQTLVVNAVANAVLVALPDATQVPVGKPIKVVLQITASSHKVTFSTVKGQTINTLSAADFNSANELGTAATSLTFVPDGSNFQASSGNI